MLFSWIRKLSWLFFPTGLLLLVVASQSGCPQTPSEPPPGDASVSERTTPPDTTVAESRQEQGQDDGKIATGPLDQPLQANQTRAGQIAKESERITGHDGISRIGDWRIYNQKVAFAIHGVGHSRFFSGGTGQIIDASPVDDKGQATRDLLEEVFPAFGLIRVIQATEIAVVEPGGVGKRAVIRVTATDVGIPTVDAVLRSQPFSGKIEVDYILEPDASHIEIVTRLIGGVRIKDLQMGDGLLLGDQTRLFAPEVGLDAASVTGKPIPYFASIGLGASYLIAPADAKARLVIPLTEAAVFPAFGAVASADEDKSEYRRLLFVGDGRLEGMLAALRKVHPADNLKKVDGQIKGITTQMEEVDVLLRLVGGAAISQTRPNADGTFHFEVPDGKYEIIAALPGHTSLQAAVTFGTTQTLTFAPGVKLKLQIKQKGLDGKIGGFVPVRVELKGPQSMRVDLSADGQLIPLPPGTYTVTVSRGLTHEYWEKELTLTANGADTVISEEVVLAQVVDTSGYVSADMHLHASPSADSELALEQRVSALAAEGIQFAVATDHDTFTDLSPVVKQLKLTPWLHTAIGQEVSLLPFHFNIYPLAQIPTDGPLYFGPGWAEYKDRTYQRTLNGPEIWANIRKKYGVKIIQINHPRSAQSYLSSIEYDPKKGIKALKDGLFDDNWDAIEIYNGKRAENFLDTNIFDWFSFLNQGLYKTAVGNSDSHTAGARPGMPRTLIASPTQEGEKIDPDLVTSNLKANQAIVYAGPMIKVSTAKGDGPGARLTGPSIELTIEVTAPSWIAVSYVKVYANGKMIQEFNVPATKDPMRFKKMLQLQPTQDTWYVVFAGDTKEDMKPIYPGFFPVSMTNPIFLDIDGDGFKAPGLQN